MAPLQSKDMKYGGANYMPAPLSVLADNDLKQRSANSAEVDMDSGADDRSNPSVTVADVNRMPQPNQNKRQTNVPCLCLSVVLVILCCVITGLEVSSLNLCRNNSFVLHVLEILVNIYLLLCCSF